MKVLHRVFIKGYQKLLDDSMHRVSVFLPIFKNR